MKMSGFNLKKNVYRLIAHLSLITVLLSFNNCSNSGFQTLQLGDLDSKSNLAGLHSDVAGAGISQAYAPGCNPQTFQDFIDNEGWDARRVEPADCAISSLANPIFSWVMPTNLKPTLPMTLTIRRTSDGGSISRTSLTPRLLLDQALTPGFYEWNVAYTNSAGQLITSATRRFLIPTDPQLLTLPTAEQFARTVAAKSHPRSLPAGSNFSALAEKAQNGEYKPAFTAFLKSAVTLQTAAIPDPPPNLTRANFSSDTEYNDWLMSLMHKAGDERTAIETLGYAGLFTNSTAYDTAAINRLLSLAAWPVDGATSEDNQDQANREIFLALGSGLDLFQNKLSPNQRTTLVNVLKNRLQQAMSKYQGFDRFPNNSHLLTATLFTTEALMYAVGTPEFPEAQDWLSQSWNAMITTFAPWGSSRDGGYANGGAYGWYTLTTLARTAATLRLVADLDLTRWPVVGDFGDNQIAQYPANAYLLGSFGDETENNHHYYDYTYDAFRLYANVTGKPKYEWYWRAFPKNLTIVTPLPAQHYLMLGVRIPQAPPTLTGLPNSWLFEDAGVVALHSQTTDSQRSSLFFRSSRFGSFNHSHADNNAFTFVSKGKEMLISGGYYPYYNSPHHALVARATRFKNALTFDGGIGQAEPSENPVTPGAPVMSMDLRGQLINFGDQGHWAFTTGDATLAYRGRNPSTGTLAPLLSQAIRTAAYNRERGIAVIYDYATSGKARKWELNFQSLQSPTRIGDTLHIKNGDVEVCLDLYGASGNFSFTSGFPIAPEKSYPTQSQSRFAVTSASNEFVAVTVIRENCSASPVTVEFHDQGAEIKIDGIPSIGFDQKTIHPYD